MAWYKHECCRAGATVRDTPSDQLMLAGSYNSDPALAHRPCLQSGVDSSRRVTPSFCATETLTASRFDDELDAQRMNIVVGFEIAVSVIAVIPICYGRQRWVVFVTQRSLSIGLYWRSLSKIWQHKASPAAPVGVPDYSVQRCILGRTDRLSIAKQPAGGYSGSRSRKHANLTGEGS